MLLGLSDLDERKCEHDFNDTINPICTCGGNIESTNHFFLHCPEYCEARRTLFDNIQSIDKMLLSQNESSLTYLLLYGDPSPILMHSFSTQHSNSYYFQEDSMDRYLTELNFFFSLIHFLMAFSLFFVYLFGYPLFLLISQLFVTFYIWFCWLLVLL